jgi:hypothetical protein
MARIKKGSHQQDWWATRVRIERIVIRPYYRRRYLLTLIPESAINMIETIKIKGGE